VTFPWPGALRDLRRAQAPLRQKSLLLWLDPAVVLPLSCKRPALLATIHLATIRVSASPPSIAAGAHSSIPTGASWSVVRRAGRGVAQRPVAQRPVAQRPDARVWAVRGDEAQPTERALQLLSRRRPQLRLDRHLAPSLATVTPVGEPCSATTIKALLAPDWLVGAQADGPRSESGNVSRRSPWRNASSGDQFSWADQLSSPTL
jgi:hypothetical protein